MAECIPFVSEYTDCTDENLCEGCRRCSCGESGRWACRAVSDCDRRPDAQITEDTINNALEELQKVFESQQKIQKTSQELHDPNSNKDGNEGELLDDKEIEQEIASLAGRRKRSTSSNSTKNVVKQDDKNSGNKIYFHHVTDELDEDTLKNSTAAGVIEAKKMKGAKLNITKHTFIGNNYSTDPLHIEFKHAQHDPIGEVKAYDSGHNKYLTVSQDKLKMLVKNQTNKNSMNKELSNLIAKELHKGTELVGSKNSPVLSNITFTPENDTAAAMALIAGNLLNKLWRIEDSSEESIETQVLKYEKITQLLELFKEPLSKHQQNFLKDALEQISDSVDKKGSLRSCAKPDFPKAELSKEVRSSEEEKDLENKLKTIIDLVKKLEDVYNRIRDFRQKKRKSSTPVPKEPTDIFGKMLKRITNLLVPDNKLKKKINDKAYERHIFGNRRSGLDKIKNMYGIELDPKNLSPKDQLLLDFLLHIESRPKCLLFQDFDKPNNDSIKGLQRKILDSILDKPPTTGKIPSWKILAPKEPLRRLNVKPVTTTERAEINEARNKLKDHLRSIIIDLGALQKAVGGPNEVNITELMPCFGNLLRDTPGFSTFGDDHYEKIKKVFEDLKDYPLSYDTRRSTSNIHSPPPKTAKIWERIILNLGGNSNPSRRSMNYATLKTFGELKTNMDELEDFSNHIYQNIDRIAKALPSERRMLLKTMNADIKQHVSILEDLKEFTSNNAGLNEDVVDEIKVFLVNTGETISYGQQVLAALKPGIQKNKPKVTVQVSAVTAAAMYDKAMLNKDKLLNQLIRNRIEIFLKNKQAQGGNLSGDVNYNIGKQVLSSLDGGNYALARELYKIFVAQKDRDTVK